MENPLVSIVTPCFNGEKFIERFLNSILNQTYSNIELILINDGSKDKTEKIIETYKAKFAKKQIEFVCEYQENSGQAAALNRGLKYITGEYLVWPDSDDELMPEFIEKKVEFLQKHREFEYCYGKSIIVNENNPENIIAINKKRKQKGRYDFFESIVFTRNVFFGGYMVKTSALKKINPDLEIYTGRGGQNAQMLLPLGWFYGEPGYVEESVYKYYIRSNSHSHSQNNCEKIIQQLYNYENILEATIKRIPDEKVLRYLKPIRKYYARIRFGNAVDSKKVKLIKEEYKRLLGNGVISIHEFALYIKYTKRMFRIIYHIEE